MHTEHVVDAKGLACPTPIVKTRKAMNDIESGEILGIVITDKGAKADLAAWSKSGGHELLDVQEDAEILTFLIKKA
ncbi:hypothetical protein CQS04_10090 [Chryseomicrobium excrementi]|uniref:UPF0033 domain-containing protein n=1 Tax=Chryseomicrobium excrementi TaxID=2041346 RepID=A0A2M9EYZ2_9BACL|nr:sulfurtransferase TusA family protein [Chryseomicrobium excrementi]PJK16430.1 hypothetical protein CQS04_10090 [Chryseomicrobium excrementi]